MCTDPSLADLMLVNPWPYALIFIAAIIAAGTFLIMCLKHT